MSADTAVLARLAAVIEARQGADPASSHTAKLLARGPAKAAQKFGEEAVEAVIEAARGDRMALAAEAADALYHLLVMLTASGVTLDAVMAELERREGVSGVEEKAARGQSPSIERATTPEQLARCLALRTEVFVAEQGVSVADEQDGRDGAARHWIATRGARTLATARVLVSGDTAKIQRVAVARAARGTGLGRRLMDAVLDEMRADRAVARVILDSQVDALGFYERLGFTPEGEVFLDAGIEHRRMVLAR